MARSATGQFLRQLSIAVEDNVSPIAIMIDPVTTGGKKRMIFFCPNALIKAANTRYRRPAAMTPRQAYGRSSG